MKLVTKTTQFAEVVVTQHLQGRKPDPRCTRARGASIMQRMAISCEQELFLREAAMFVSKTIAHMQLASFSRRPR